ncbi:NADH-dependent FMN reductase RutF [Cronobacter sakazakii]|uniref:NADH-dependent FMN reductase RutF n=1 Tax=Cronobacter sakazakii TaxID=28141 RepID=UPI000CFB70C6|nr:pyrimidine utilization flavin reductase protein F [Cronobacter sakazakii]EGT4508022.1 pyrimidine utilization flavin reductase protein F [Cronobacter sakazakii]ELY4346169.1 pyrimidine utilization flavin reductase protein F [Cronobacter sakazakii]ELY4348539.1 pyrimidine utilization flavin reductase protein F [Cronobacter sakazakii]ELY4759708.1 pyrimidine utilization flavin reductase protein F [Cronobacter sakazakii]ELY6298091.1 pyrimidine utilization flavin reductase protein F [Cronobacter sa
MSEQQAFRDAMSRLGAAVNIVTTDGPAGMAGFTASAVCSVTDSPPTLLVCLNRNASVWPVFQANGQLCVNTLAAGHEALSALFGGKTPMEERFAAARWHRGVTGSPKLDGAVVSFDCRVEQVVPVSTHDVLLCRVLEISRNDDTHGLVWFDRRYHALSRPVCGLAS